MNAREGGWRAAVTCAVEQLLGLIDELSDQEAEAALARPVRQRELLMQWTEPEDVEATEDAWALANSREAIREEPW